MGANGYWAPRANLIARGKKIDLTLYLGNSLNNNLLSQSSKNPARLTTLSFSQEKFMTHLPILADFPLEEAIRPPKWLKSLSSTTRSSLKRLMSKEFSSLNTGRRKLLTTSLQSDSKLTNGKEESVKRRTPVVHQVSKALVVPKTFKFPGNRNRFQDLNALQTTNEFTIRKLPIHPNGPTGNLPLNKVEENGNCLTRSPPNLKI